jgi:hypothetical protein
VPHVQRAERSAHARIGVVYIKSTLHAGAAICSLSICKLAAVKVPISHIASQAGGLRGMLTFQTTKAFLTILYIYIYIRLRMSQMC